MLRISTVARGAVLMLVISTPALGQTTEPPVTRVASLAGPRAGLTILSEETVAKLQEHGVTVAPVISQFGWQFEKRFYHNGDGLTAVTEWVLLLGGLDQGVALPSLSWLVGMRTAQGAEFGVGPNLTALGAGLAIAAGTTFRAGALNVPVNIAVVPSKTGLRVSLLTGFNVRR
jgi:hypothetical protein